MITYSVLRDTPNGWQVLYSTVGGQSGMMVEVYLTDAQKRDPRVARDIVMSNAPPSLLAVVPAAETSLLKPALFANSRIYFKDL